MLLDFDVTNIYYCGIVVMAMSVRIREKNIKVSDHKLFAVFSGKQNLYF